MNCKCAFRRSRQLLCLLPVIALLSVASGGEVKKESPKKEMHMTDIYDFKVADIDGNDVNLADYKGKALLIVNVASKCGFTPQYKGLENIYCQYKDKGFEILAFPSNDFMGQEPGTNEQIKTFCQLNYQVSFSLFSKISVKGENIHPLYKFLTEKSTNPKFAGSITWNFNKFLIDRKGNIVNRFDSREEPQSPEVIKAIENALQ
ncbi:MAG: glutathione peroxidase [Sedimentisphaerales bacterium]